MKVRAVNLDTGTVLFSGSEAAFEIWRKSHSMKRTYSSHGPEIRKSQSGFGPSGRGNGRVLVGGKVSLDDIGSASHMGTVEYRGCHSARAGNL
jgi:hypothetical protein